MGDLTYTAWILILPFIAFLVTGLLGNKMKPLVSGIIATVGIVISTILSLIVAYSYFFDIGNEGGVYQKILAFNFEWLRFTDTLRIDIGILLDPISVMMMVVITLVSSMVFIYSLGYMKGDSGFARFFSCLSLFSFSMLGLVVATNIFQMYIFWELVGLSSYLLIGFYYDKPSAVAASKKAFIVTRFADLGFLIGILLLSYITGTFDFIQLTDPNGAAIAQGSSIAFLGLSTITWALILIFIGGAGKSAMFPLHIWLPDAMEGPTPVSALIHAATMVVAGVYLVARLFPIFATSGQSDLEVVAFIGAITALFAALVACTQTDIKRILAYSTMSQIGYMMLALGVSGYEGEGGLGYMASMFHLFNHAMFKALLFLGAGAIIHAVHSNFMTDMGNLKKYLPVTHITFLIACLAISGIPPFSGFFSKDEILVAVFQHNKVYFIVAQFVAGLTAFYIFRLYFSVFWGKSRDYVKTPHEPPLTMTIPLILLALGSALTGFIPFGKLVTANGVALNTDFHWNIVIISMAMASVGLVIAYLFYRKESPLPERFSIAIGYLYRTTLNKFYVDELYLFITKKIIFNYISKPIAWFDRNIVDGVMNSIAVITNFISAMIKGFQSGQLQHYGLVFISGVILIVIIFIYLT